MSNTESVPVGAITIHRPEFHGRAGEYFGIWFVNLLLSIVTLGIYSAWAKVRTERYFYANTRLAGASFDYLASPIAILKGRLVAYAVVIAMVIASRYSPLLYALMAIGIALMAPALIVWSLRFRARVSAWRGLSFRFDNGAGAAYEPFMLWGFLMALSGTLLYPLMVMRQHRFVSEGHRYGSGRFSFHGDAGAYYIPYVVVVSICIALMAAMLVSLFMAIGQTAASPGGLPAKPPMAVFVMMIIAYLGFFAMTIVLRVRYANLFWNSTRLESHRFESSLRARDMLWLYGSNMVAIICTVGLAVPWAMVRLARYRAAHFALHANGSIEDFAAAPDSEHGAAPSELVDALDVDIGIGL